MTFPFREQGEETDSTFRKMTGMNAGKSGIAVAGSVWNCRKKKVKAEAFTPTFLISD